MKIKQSIINRMRIILKEAESIEYDVSVGSDISKDDVKNVEDTIEEYLDLIDKCMYWYPSP